MTNSYFTTAQVCLQGHVLSRNYSPELGTKFCKECGEKTITNCTHCNAPIRGVLITPGVLRSSREFVPPSYCHECGKPYNWTIERLEAAKELADLIEELSDEEREDLKKSLDQLVEDSPKAVVAQTKFKRLVSKAGPEIAAGFKSILIDIVSESVKKSIWG